MDAALNLPCELYSHVVRRAVAERAACDSYEEVVAAIGERTGMTIGKRQVEQMAARAARDFDDFYAHREADQENTGDLLVLTFDGKGVPMRREDLRPETRAAAEATPRRLHTRLDQGREAPPQAHGGGCSRLHGGAVRAHDGRCACRPAPGPRRRARSATSSSEQQARVGEPHQARRPSSATPSSRRVAATRTSSAPGSCSLDGNRDQLKLVKKTARKLGVEVTIVVDLIHVLEYLWKAAYAFHEEGSKEAEQWVQQRLMWLLQGEAAKVSDNLRRNARDAKLEGAALKPVKKCLRYLRGVRDYIAYDRALAAGLPIATGVIEGACRYLVKDRMERTGARWSLVGAEAVLRLRALRASGDFDDYWAFHLEREHERNHRPPLRRRPGRPHPCPRSSRAYDA